MAIISLNWAIAVLRGRKEAEIEGGREEGREEGRKGEGVGRREGGMGGREGQSPSN